MYQEDNENLYVLTDTANVGSSSGWTEVGSGGGGGGDVTPENVTQALVEATTISVADQATIRANINTGSGGDQFADQAALEAFITDKPGFRTDIGSVGLTGDEDIAGIKEFTSRIDVTNSVTNGIPEVRFIGDGTDQVLGQLGFFFNDTSKRGGIELHRNGGSGYTFNFDVGQVDQVFIIEDDGTIRLGSSGAKVNATDLRNLTELPLLPDGDGTTQKSVLQTVGANGSETYTWVPEPAGADGSGYDKVTINGGTALTQEDTLNFGNEFTGADGTDATDIGLATTLEGERIFKLGSGEEFKVINASDDELFRVNNTNVEINNNADLILHDDSITNVGDNALRWEYSDLGGDFPAGHHSSFDIKLFSILSGNNDVDLAPQIEFQTNTLRSGTGYERTGLLDFTRRDSDPDVDSVSYASITPESRNSLDSRFVFRVTDDNGVTTDPVFYMENDKVRTKQTFEVDMDSDPTFQLISSETAADGNEAGRIDFIAEALGGKATMASIFATVEDSSTLDGEIQIQIKNGSVDDVVLQADTVNGLSLPIVSDGTAGVVGIDANGVLSRVAAGGGGGSDVPDTPDNGDSEVDYILKVPASTDTDTTATWSVLPAAGGSDFTTNITSTKTDPTLSLISDETAADGNEIGRVNFVGLNTGGDDTTYGRIVFDASDVSDGSEDSDMTISAYDAGALRQTVKITAGTVAVGSRSTAASTGATALGRFAAANGVGTLALGQNSTAIGVNAIAIGNGVTNATANRIHIGTSTETVFLPGDVTLDGIADGTVGAVGIDASGVLSRIIAGGDVPDAPARGGSLTNYVLQVPSGTEEDIVWAESTGGGSNVPDSPERGDSDVEYVLNVPTDSLNAITWKVASAAGGSAFTTDLSITKTDPMAAFISDEGYVVGNEVGRLNFRGRNSDDDATVTYATIFVDNSSLITIGDSSNTIMTPGLAQFKGNTNHIDDPSNSSASGYNASSIGFSSLESTTDGEEDYYIGASIHEYIVDRNSNNTELHFFAGDGNSADELLLNIGNTRAHFGDLDSEIQDRTGDLDANIRDAYPLNTNSFQTNDFYRYNNFSAIEDTFLNDRTPGDKLPLYIGLTQGRWRLKNNTSDATNVTNLVETRHEYNEDTNDRWGSHIISTWIGDRDSATVEQYDTVKVEPGEVTIFGDTNDDTDGDKIFIAKQAGTFFYTFAEVTGSGAYRTSDTATNATAAYEGVTGGTTDTVARTYRRMEYNSEVLYRVEGEASDAWQAQIWRYTGDKTTIGDNQNTDINDNHQVMTPDKYYEI